MMESEYATPHSPSPAERGHLVLADISGYTAFLSRTELEHAQEILTDLLKTILQRVKTLLTIEKKPRGLASSPTAAMHTLSVARPCWNSWRRSTRTFANA